MPNLLEIKYSTPSTMTETWKPASAKNEADDSINLPKACLDSKDFKIPLIRTSNTPTSAKVLYQWSLRLLIMIAILQHMNHTYAPIAFRCIVLELCQVPAEGGRCHWIVEIVTHQSRECLRKAITIKCCVLSHCNRNCAKNIYINCTIITARHRHTKLDDDPPLSSCWCSSVALHSE